MLLRLFSAYHLVMLVLLKVLTQDLIGPSACLSIQLVFRCVLIINKASVDYLRFTLSMILVRQISIICGASSERVHHLLI
jgi:hypothetical protein